MSVPARWLPSAGALLCGVVSLSGCKETLPEPMPEPPDMSALVQAYESPRAPLTPETVAELVRRGNDTLERLEAIDLAGTGPIGDAIDLVRDAIDEYALLESSLIEKGWTRTRESAIEIGGKTLEGEGFLRVERICDGWGEVPVPDEAANGIVRLTMTFTESTVDPTIWGQFLNCLYPSGEKQLRLQGTVRVFTGLEIDFTELDWLSLEPLIELGGTVDVDGEPYVSQIDFRSLLDGLLEIRLPVSEGEVIFWAGATGQGFRASNGNWGCDFGLRSCTAGDEAITW